MLAKDPAQRYSSADDLAVDLQALQTTATHSGLSSLEPFSRSRHRPGKRWSMFTAALLVASVVAVASYAPARQRIKAWLGFDSIPRAKQVAVLQSPSIVIELARLFFSLLPLPSDKRRFA
jgi:hypothetical protein